MKITQERILTFLKELKPEIEALGIEELALFGSYATKQENVYSDIDIAIKKRNDFLRYHSAYEYFSIVEKIKQKIMKTLHRNADVYDLDSDSPFSDKIKKELIYV